MVLSSSQRRFLADLFGADCLFNQEQTLSFGYDSSRIFTPPLAVVRARNVDQIVRLMAWSLEQNMPIYPRGSGTNVVGACVPVKSGLVLSTLAMDKILEINSRDFVAVVEPGLITAKLQAAVEAQGLFYPPDPASAKLSTIGGNVATGAAGLRAVKYGGTRDYVLGLQVVLPGGQLINTGGRVHKNAVGLDLTSLLVGSEGALAVITRITLKLLPKPQSSASLLAAYHETDQALAAAQSVFEAGIMPVAMEFMPHGVLHCLTLTGKSMPWPVEAKAVLLLKLDGAERALPKELALLKKTIAAANPLYIQDSQGESEEKLWEPRRLINPASFLLKPDKLSNDIVVPRGAASQAFERIDRIKKEYKLEILAFGHLGDGNIHVNIMYDDKNQTEAEQARKARDLVLQMALELKGSISGEHRIGLTKADWLPKQLSPEERQIMSSIKKTFDPHELLNPGKWLNSGRDI